MQRTAHSCTSAWSCDNAGDT
ncbi:hypothetical protein ADUPG1_014458, partial [Aduncisulcus paluster]